MEKQWYVVHTLTGQENKVRSNILKMAESVGLDPRFGRILVPTEEEIRSQAGQKRVIKKKLFPGYVLVEMDLNDDTWHLVRRTAGVTGFVSSGSSARPAPLRKEEVANVLRTVGEEAVRPKAVWEVGEGVRVVDGPFAEMTGKIVEVNPEHEKLKVNITIFGRETPVDLAFTDVEKL
jgi:transcriptional antiterminator NusG